MPQKKYTDNILQLGRKLMACAECDMYDEYVAMDTSRVVCSICFVKSCAPPVSIKKVADHEKKERGWQKRKMYASPDMKFYSFGKEISNELYAQLLQTSNGNDSVEKLPTKRKPDPATATTPTAGIAKKRRPAGTATSKPKRKVSKHTA